MYTGNGIILTSQWYSSPH